MSLDFPDVTREEDADRWEARVRASLPKGRTLDTAEETVRGTPVLPTSYHPTRLLITTDGEDVPGVIELLEGAARGFGWRVEVRAAAEELGTGEPRAPEEQDQTGLPTPRVAVIQPDVREERDDLAPHAIDAWKLLQAARRLASRAVADTPLTSVGLDHVLTIAATPPPIRSSSPDMPARLSGPANLPGPDSYSRVGAGGRQVVDFIGQPPVRHEPSPYGGRRPVIAYFDTGCGIHPWLNPIVTTYPTGPNGRTIGFASPTTDPEVNGDRLGRHDGFLDPFAGHGTFVAGILHQTCPDADILSIRVSDGSGELFESVFLGALRDLVDWVTGSYGGEALALDVLSLSLGFSHETPTSGNFDTAVRELLVTLRQHGCAVVCSAGNSSFDRPLFPAALWEWPGSRLGLPSEDDLAPHIAVGAINPARDSIALFSNFGPWVNIYAPGVSVLSTAPGHQGGVQAGSSNPVRSLKRESLDPDDFRGGFAIGSGTSYAAPYIAGRLANALVPGLMNAEPGSASRIDELHHAVVQLIHEFPTPTT